MLIGESYRGAIQAAARDALSVRTEVKILGREK